MNMLNSGFKPNLMMVPRLPLRPLGVTYARNYLRSAGSDSFGSGTTPVPARNPIPTSAPAQFPSNTSPHAEKAPQKLVKQWLHICSRHIHFLMRPRPHTQLRIFLLFM